MFFMNLSSFFGDRITTSRRIGFNMAHPAQIFNRSTLALEQAGRFVYIGRAERASSQQCGRGPVFMMRKIIRGLIVIVGSLLLLCAFLSGTGALVAFAERLKHGAGLMFADVEFLILIAVALGVSGGLLLWLGLRIARQPANQSPESG
jgi:hypothetical protein